MLRAAEGCTRLGVGECLHLWPAWGGMNEWSESPKVFCVGSPWPGPGPTPISPLHAGALVSPILSP